MAVKIVQTVLAAGTEVGEPDQVDMLCDFISPLVTDGDAYEGDEEVSSCHTALRRTCRLRQDSSWTSVFP